MGKILFWAVIIVGGLLAARILAHHAARQQTKRDQVKARQSNPIGQSEEMVRCGQCGIHLPRSEAIKQGGEFWCSPEHAQLKQRS